jgi:signal transduction histidine kinase
MASGPARSFATRLTLTYVGAAIALMLLIGLASMLFTFRLYARTSNEIIASAARFVAQRAAQQQFRNVPPAQLAERLTSDLDRPRIRIAVYDENRRLLSATAPRRDHTGFVGAVASLMGLREQQVPMPGGGFVIVNADLTQLSDTLRSYWIWMLPVGVLAIVLAWAGGWFIARRAVLPLTLISAAMRRFAHGDFRPEPIHSSGDDEIGELAHSYNAALLQVNSAFSQRDRTEGEIRQFIADAGHELRTPLTVIMGYLDVLEDGALDAPAIRERVLGTLRQESRRMRSLIDKLIYLARLERGESTAPEVVDVSSVVASVVSSLPPQEDAAPIGVSLAADALVVADGSDMAEAVRNILDNALKYAPGSIITIGTSVDDDGVSVIVRDTGPGMSEQDRVHAFDRFYRGGANGDVPGSGLGLAIVKRAVERSHGTIVLESSAGAGTRFTLRFPRAGSVA